MWMLNIRTIVDGKDGDSLLFNFRTLYDAYKMVENVENTIVLGRDDSVYYAIECTMEGSKCF